MSAFSDYSQRCLEETKQRLTAQIVEQCKPSGVLLRAFPEMIAEGIALLQADMDADRTRWPRDPRAPW